MKDDERNRIVGEILAASGGAGNISELRCCATRLRLVFADESLVRKEAFGRIPGVFGVLIRGVEYQLVIGLAAGEVYRSFIDKKILKIH